MAELKLGTQIGGNLVWHQGILDLNPVDDKLFFRQFDVITDIGGQTINGGLSLKGDVDTTGRVFGVGANASWASYPKGAFSQIIENDSNAHWLMTSNRKDGSARAGIQVLTSDTGIMRLYTDNISKYVDIGGGQIAVQATMPSSASHLTRKDYVDAEVKRSMDYTDSKDAVSTKAIEDLDKKVGTLDAQNVKITGNQTIAGTKTFGSHITVPAADPTVATQAAHKGYVDKLNATSVKGVTAISPIISTGGINPVISIAPASRASSGSMSSNDKIKLDDLPADALSRSGGTMKNNCIIKLDGGGGIKSITGGKEYSIFHDHNNGNVTVSGAGGDLFIGYKIGDQTYTKDVFLCSTMKWLDSGRVLVDSDGFIPWASVKDRIGLEGKSQQLKGPIDFDNLNLTGDYNLYLARAAGSKNPPPFDYGTMSVVGSETDGNTFVTQMATDLRTNIVYVRTRSDGTWAWTAWKKNLNEDSDVGYGYHQKFEVGGDANTFYPVSINITGGHSGYSWKRYSFSRSYAAKAPDTWNNQTHKGGLTFEFQMANDSGWGGNSQDVIVNECNQTYTTVCGGMIQTTGSVIVWLRGGGAEYMFHSDEGNKTSVVVNLDRYIAPDNREFLTRTVDEAIAGYTAEILPRWSIRNGELFDRNRRVMLPDSDVGLTIRNSAPMIQFVETDQNDKTYTMVADGGGIRMQEDSTGVGGKVLYQYHPSWEGISLLKPFTDAMGTGTKSLVTKEYSDDQDAKRVAKTGDVMTGSLTFTNDSQLVWNRNTDWAKIGFKNDSDSDVDSYMWFETGDNKNEYFKFRMHNTTGDKHELIDIKLDKTQFYNNIVANQVKNAINVHGKGSISFEDGSNARFHLWADGNAFRLNHGVNAETNIISVLPDGNTSSIGSFTAKDFIQTTAQTNNAAASTRKDYVDNLVGTLRNDVYSKGGSDARYVIKTGDTMTGSLINTKSITSNTALAVDANTRKLALEVGADQIPYISVDYAYRALQFNDKRTVTATNGFEINGNNAYSDYFVRYAGYVGGWARGLRAINAADAIGAGIGFTGTADTVTGVYMGLGTSPWSGDTGIKIDSSSINLNQLALAKSNISSTNTAPYVELHKPGHVAYSWNIAADNRLMLSQTNGSGVVAGDIVAFNAGDSVIRINAQRWTNARSHSYAAQYAQNAPITVDFGAGAGTSDYYPIIKGRHVAVAAGYTTDVELGILRAAPSGNGWGIGHIRVGSGEGATPQAIYSFDISGNFAAPGGVYGAGVYDSGNRCYSASNPVPAGHHNHANLRARDAVIIWDGDIGNGNFTLTRPWSDFDFVCFCVLWDDYGGLSTKTFSRYDLEINQSIGANYDISGGAGGIQWMGRFAADNRSFATSYENGRMRHVYGYNMGTVN